MTSIEMARDEIHVWQAPLSVSDEVVARLRDQLSPDESKYSGDFANARARRQYVVSRGTLRRLLSRYTGHPAKSHQFETTGDGKPVLTEPSAIEFNLSHSGDLVVYAVAASRAVGIDLERVRPMPRAVDLARRYLSSAEHRAVVEAPLETRDREFLSSWVLREARAKAQGESIWRALETRRGPPVVSADEKYAVRLIDSFSEDYVAAVAALGSDWRVVLCGTLHES